ncbi:MAG: 3-oxoacyl-ACP synthase [Chloroflexi bacterium]|nr:3-oxoacyl-ACP synthase [Chloroflexota bacterium]
MTETVGIAGLGTYFPPKVETAADLVAVTNIPEDILREKMGIRQRHIAEEADSVTHMATEAAQRALSDAAVSAEQVNLVVSHGSEHKDHLIWNAAAKIQQNLGAVNAYAFEMYALCAGAPIAMNMAKGMMLNDPSLEYVMLAAASRENDMVNLRNMRSRFMFNFGAGGGAMLLRRNSDRNLILGSAAYTDATLSESVILTDEAVGDEQPIQGDLKGRLDVTDPAYMSERLGEVSLDNFLRVMGEALAKSDATFDDVAFLGITHMKRSFFNLIIEQVGLTQEQAIYLHDYGHIQSVDQVLALELGLKEGKIQDGDLVLLVGAGTGYTWSATVVRWGPH